MKARSILIVVFTVLLSSSLFAQPGPGKGMQRGPGFEPERMLDHLKFRLELTDEQYNSIKDVLFETEKQMVDIRKKAFEERQQRREQRQALMDETHQKIKEFLTEEQAAEFDKMREYRQERREERLERWDDCRPGIGRRNRW